MRKKDGPDLARVVIVTMVLGVLLAGPGDSVRVFIARLVLGAATGLLIGSLAICVRIYTAQRGKRDR